jgi:hypothetical protein
MIYLKIEDNKGYYWKQGDQLAYIEIDKINREDLMELLNAAINLDFEMDEFVEDNLANKAHQIIYKNIYQKITELLPQKTRFKDESENLFRVAFEKYSTEESGS